MNIGDILKSPLFYFSAGFLGCELFRHLRKSENEAIEKTQTETPKSEIIPTNHSNVDELIQFEYGLPCEIINFASINKNLADFIPRIAALSAQKIVEKEGTRSLDIGCGVGRATFELSRYYNHSVGVDIDSEKISVCESLKAKGQILYNVEIEGEMKGRRKAIVPIDINTSHCEFVCCDVLANCDFLGEFDLVLASNILHILFDPFAFLRKCKKLVKNNGIIVISSSFDWKNGFTPKENWLGGKKEVVDGEGNVIRSLEMLKEILIEEGFILEQQCDMPMIHRQNHRKWSVEINWTGIFRKTKKTNQK